MHTPEVVEWRRGEFVVSTDPARLDLDLIYTFLTNCYWAKGIPRELVARSMEHSLCFGIYDESTSPRSRKECEKGGATAMEFPGLAKEARPGGARPRQVGFARVVSDFATVAYLGDVFVLESHRGRGLGKWMMECIMQHPALQDCDGGFC